MNLKIFCLLVISFFTSIVNATEVSSCYESEQELIRSKVVPDYLASEMTLNNRSELKLDYLCVSKIM